MMVSIFTRNYFVWGAVIYKILGKRIFPKFDVGINIKNLI